MNYVGNKHKLLDKLFEYFPKDTDCFVDLFCGGCDVSINYKPLNLKTVYANDINYHVIAIYECLKINSIDIILSHLYGRRDQYNLSKTNEQSFKEFRDWFNAEKMKFPLDLFLLMCYSFNNQMRFNNKHEYNSSFGRNRSEFNSTIEDNLIKFKKEITNINFSKEDFINFDYSILDKYPNSFIYCDPPYRLGCAAYNDGKRGFRGWSEKDDKDLLHILDELSTFGTRFALSNVIEHKGETNDVLIEWVKKNGYNVIPMNYNYNNCNYQAKNREYKTKEVLITNY